MEKPYSQRIALMAITKASFRAIIKSPQTLFFSILFPLIFVFIFGSFGNRGGAGFTVAVAPQSDTSNRLFQAIRQSGLVNIKQFTDTVEMRTQLEKGNISGILLIQQTTDSAMPFNIIIRHTNATSVQIARLLPFLQNLSYQLGGAKGIAAIDTKSQLYAIRPYRQIDFVLPGQIGFSILFSTLFGIAFTFFNMREQLILKRFFATPVRRIYILIGIGISRLAFQLLSVLVLTTIGYFFLNFTLVNGFVTLLNMLLMSILFLFMLMGVGLIFSGIAKTDSTIPLFINIFCLPQIMLSGTFFTTEVFPEWLQKLCQVFPLTHFNNAIRKIAFEGASIVQCLPEIGVLLLWTAIAYLLASRMFKWD